MNSSPKHEIAEQLRQAIVQASPDALENDRVEASLCALSFQSKSHPERHI